jgi:nicotinate-nucleotide pyrophosphorylase (carboxylating)
MHQDINKLPLETFFEQLAPDAAAHIDLALREDLGPESAALDHDITARLMVEPGRRGVAAFRSRSAGRLAGSPLLPLIAHRIDPSLHVQLRYSDGMAIRPGETFATISGPLRSILAAERTMLNYLGLLCGIATLTARFVEMTEGTVAKIYDTRKTVPGLRRLSKYAVRCGGGFCHRMGLFDAVLIKDNHLAHLPPPQWAPHLTAAIQAARQLPHVAFVEVEVDTLSQFRSVVSLPVDVILLDNMTPEQLREAVYIRNELGSAALLEASGGVNLATLAEIAQTGVDRIAIGAITHSAPVLDIGLDIA